MTENNKEYVEPEEEDIVEGRFVENGEAQPPNTGGQAGTKAAEASTAELDEVIRLQGDLEEAHAKIDEYLGGWQRALADFANYKKRVERDQAMTQQNMVSSIVRRYLDVLDDLERALKNRPQAGEGEAWAEGIELVYRKFLAALQSEGVVQYNPTGETFDPNLHEAISHEPTDEYESGEIIEVVSPGYSINDRVIRPARVRVAR